MIYDWWFSEDLQQHAAEAGAQLQAQLLLWHEHHGSRRHTHRRGDVSHVHRTEAGPQGGVIRLTVWEDGEVE